MVHHKLCAALAALGVAAAPATAAPDGDWRRAFEELQREYREQHAKDQARIEQLEKRLAEGDSKPSDLQKQIDELLDRVDTIDTKVGAAKPPGGGAARYIDVSFNSLFTAGTSTAPEDELQMLEGGHHDPHKRGFTVQNAELVLSGAVDPYFKGAANVVYALDSAGESVVELEEAYLQTTSLPGGLQFKAGQFFTEFGRINAQHPHQWDFVDQPVVNTRFFGDDGLRGPGARASWLAPTGFPLELQFGAHNANGPTQVPFIGPPEDGFPTGAVHDREVDSWNDLVYTARVAASWDVSDDLPVQFGVSRAWGPSGASDAGTSSVTGIDLTAKWKPLTNDHGYPFVSFQAEWMRRDLGYDSYIDGTTFVPGGALEDSGGYAQLAWGFLRDWTLGVRYDRANGDSADVFGLDDRNRYSAALTYYTSEFAKIRLQVNHDSAQSLDDDATSVWLQFEINLGVHGAHRF
jgi:hypothetical protein